MRAIDRVTPAIDIEARRIAAKRWTPPNRGVLKVDNNSPLDQHSWAKRNPERRLASPEADGNTRWFSRNKHHGNYDITDAPFDTLPRSVTWNTLEPIREDLSRQYVTWRRATLMPVKTPQDEVKRQTLRQNPPEFLKRQLHGARSNN